MRNARFWVYENGDWVKLTLRPGQELRWGWWARHEEGWSSGDHTWYIDGPNVVEEWSSDGRDCDGRLGSSGVRECPIDDLRAVAVTSCYRGEGGPVDEKGDRLRRPAWETAKNGRTVVYDQSAQMAGY